MERLLAELKETGVKQPVEIHVYNKNQFFGAGEIYRPDQPHYLSMNITDAEIDIWRKEPPEPVVNQCTTFKQWCARKGLSDLSKLNSGFSPRAVIGEYLEQGFDKLVEHAPINMSVHKLMEEVSGLEAIEGGYRTISASKQHQRLVYAHIMLATGHPCRKLSTKEKKYESYTPDAPSPFIPFIYPVEQCLADIPAGAVVGIKGMGLTFVDAVLALTQGRGGTFDTGPDGQLVYLNSGKEPGLILPYSKSGIPMIGRWQRMPPDPDDLRFFTSAAVQQIQEEHEKIDFEQHLWPLLQQEFSYQYYRRLFAAHSFDMAHGNEGDFHWFSEQINIFHDRFPEVPRFSLSDFLHPMQELHSERSDALHDAVVQYISRCNADMEASAPGRPSPLLALVRTWDLANPVFARVYNFGGLTPDSQKHFDSKYFGLFNRITYGPPLHNMKKVAALAKAGIIHFGLAAGGEEEYKPGEGRFVLRSSRVKEQHHLDYLVDARIPKVRFQDDDEGLYHQLLQQGDIRLFTNTYIDGSAYTPGGVEVTPEGSAVNSEGQINEHLGLVGTPTEGTTFDNDALSPYRNNLAVPWAKRVAHALSKQPQKHATLA